MNRRRRNLLIQIGLGLSVGAAVPLAVVGALLVLDRDGGATVRIAPTSEAAQAPPGLRVTQGKELERYLLTKEELGAGWAAFDRGSGSGGTMNTAIKSVPDFPSDCANFQSSRTRAFRTPSAWNWLFNNRARQTMAETIYVFQPGMAQETMAYLRGLIARCGTYEDEVRFENRVVGTIQAKVTATNGPRLGDESLRVSTRQTYSGRVGGDSNVEGVYVRRGDTVLFCSGTGLTDDLVGRAFAKIK